MITVVLDASNLAFRKATRDFDFGRVLEVRDRWVARNPGAVVHAVLDASTLRKMVDRRPVDEARRERWLDLATGDADDRILDLAYRHGAAIVSHDNFKDARSEHPWLQGCSDRVFSVRRVKGAVHLWPRQLKILTTEEIDRARADKARKAGIRLGEDDRTWRCSASPGPGSCAYAGQVIPPGLVTQPRPNGPAMCRCGYPAQEVLLEAPAPPLAGAEVAVMHGSLLQEAVPLAADPVLFGRGGPKRPHVRDVAAGLADETEISKKHVELFLDDDGHPVAIHRAEYNTTFLNPSFDEDGLPADNRMLLDVEYQVIDSDVLVLGSGQVTLVVSAPGGPGA